MPVQVPLLPLNFSLNVSLLLVCALLLLLSPLNFSLNMALLLVAPLPALVLAPEARW